MTAPPDGSAPCRSRVEVLRHPVMRGVNRHVKIAASGGVVPPPDGGRSADVRDPNMHAYISHIRFQQAEAKRRNEPARLEQLTVTCREYATCDVLGWATCVSDYLNYEPSDGQVLYNDWTVAGNNNINYGVIDWTLPNDARVAIIGDWGTGLPDAIALVEEIMMLSPQPSALVHIGDTYYGGTPDQCTDNIVNALASAAPGVPVFVLAGNHDYYSWGTGFYPMLASLNSSNASQSQQASYFCLRTADNLWQILAADTGQGDTDPADELYPVTGPALRPTEITWHQNKLSTFSGSTILMTHHQFFSNNETINNDSAYPPYLNMNLGSVFAPYFNAISAWFWGHEHNLGIFQNGLFGLAMGRLLGNSAYEEATTDNPYTDNFPEVPYASTNVQLTAADGYYPHSCAVIDFARTSPDDPISVTYYQTPSWYESPPSPLPGLTPILTETIGTATTQSGS